MWRWWESHRSVSYTHLDVYKRQGLNIAYTPMQVIMNYFNKVDNTTLMTAFAALCIPLLAGLSQWYSTKLMTANQPQQSEDAPGANMMKSMNVTMPLMSVFFCFSFASGIGLYWVAQSVFTCLLYTSRCV